MPATTCEISKENPLSSPLIPNEFNTIGFQKPPKIPKSSNSSRPSDVLLDREERAVAELLTRFKNLVSLAAMPDGGGEAKDKRDKGAIKEIAASHAFQMEVESNALVQAAEDLLQLTRELKEIWLAGPLRDIGEDEEDDKMGEDARIVGEMADAILKRASELKTGATIALQ